MSKMDQEPFVKLEGVKKIFKVGDKEFLAVQDVTLDVREGELVQV